MEGSSSQSSPKENWFKLGVLQPWSGQQSAIHIEIDKTCCFRSNAQPYGAFWPLSSAAVSVPPGT